MTFLGMQTLVGNQINQVVTDDTLTVTETEVKANLNRGYQKIVNRLVNLGQDYYLQLTKADLVANQSSYGLPDDFRKLDRIEIGYGSSATRYKARGINRNSINDPQYVFSQSNPAYSLVGNQLELFPTPTANVTAGLWMWYFEGVADMVDDSDEPNLPLTYADLPIEYAVGKAKIRQGLIEEGQLMLSEFYAEIQRMEEEVVDRETDDADRIIIRDPYA